MEEFCKGLFKGMLIGAVVGMCVGGVVVAKNKNLARKINSAADKAEEKMNEAKDKIQEKIEECGCVSEKSSGENEQTQTVYGDENQNKSRKSRN